MKISPLQVLETEKMASYFFSVISIMAPNGDNVYKYQVKFFSR